MDWVVHYFDRKLNRETVSREYGAKEGALRNACDLMRRQCDVRYIEGPERERVNAPEIYAWCKTHRTAERPKDTTERPKDKDSLSIAACRITREAPSFP